MCPAGQGRPRRGRGPGTEWALLRYLGVRPQWSPERVFAGKYMCAWCCLTRKCCQALESIGGGNSGCPREVRDVCPPAEGAERAFAGIYPPEAQTLQPLAIMLFERSERPGDRRFRSDPQVL